MGWFSTKPLSSKKLERLILRLVKNKAERLTYGLCYYKQIVLALGPVELEHYRAFLSDLQESLTKRLTAWYALQGVESGPVIVLKRGEDKTTVWGAFEQVHVEDALVEA